jgi:hypothetical protein
MRRRRELFGLLLVRWGFAAVVAAAIAIGFAVAVSATPPADIPTLALRATAVYRVEVGAAVFFGLYLATMAFALALQNRGFTDIGTGGIRARDLAAVSEDAVAEDVSMELLSEVMGEVRELQTWQEEIENAR